MRGPLIICSFMFINIQSKKTVRPELYLGARVILCKKETFMLCINNNPHFLLFIGGKYYVDTISYVYALQKK